MFKAWAPHFFLIDVPSKFCFRTTRAIHIGIKSRRYWFHQLNYSKLHIKRIAILGLCWWTKFILGIRSNLIRNSLSNKFRPSQKMYLLLTVHGNVVYTSGRFIAKLHVPYWLHRFKFTFYISLLKLTFYFFIPRSCIKAITMNHCLITNWSSIQEISCEPFIMLFKFHFYCAMELLLLKKINSDTLRFDQCKKMTKEILKNAIIKWFPILPRNCVM